MCAFTTKFFARRLSLTLEAADTHTTSETPADNLYQLIADHPYEFFTIADLANKLEISQRQVLAIMPQLEGRIAHDPDAGFYIPKQPAKGLPIIGPNDPLPEWLGYLDPSAFVDDVHVVPKLAYPFAFYAGELYLLEQHDAYHSSLVNSIPPGPKEALAAIYFHGSQVHRNEALFGRIAYKVRYTNSRNPERNLEIPQIASVYDLGMPNPPTFPGLVEGTVQALLARNYLNKYGVMVVSGQAHRAGQLANSGHQEQELTPEQQELRRQINQMVAAIHLGFDQYGRPVDKRQLRAQVDQLYAQLNGEEYKAAGLWVSPKAMRKHRLHNMGVHHDWWRGTSESKQHL